MSDGGFDAEIVLHLHEPDHEAALAATSAACQALERLGYTVTQKPTLPYTPISSPEEIRRMLGEENEQ